MGWKETGEDRVKRFRIYKELEDKYNEAVAQIQRLEGEIVRKDDLIRRLSEEVVGSTKRAGPGITGSPRIYHGPESTPVASAVSTPRGQHQQGTLPVPGDGEPAVEVSETEIRGLGRVTISKEEFNAIQDRIDELEAKSEERAGLERRLLAVLEAMSATGLPTAPVAASPTQPQPKTGHSHQSAPKKGRK